MQELLAHGIRFLAALAVGGGVVAALIGIGVAETIAIVLGWFVFLGLGAVLAARLSRRHHRSG